MNSHTVTVQRSVKKIYWLGGAWAVLLFPLIAAGFLAEPNKYGFIGPSVLMSLLFLHWIKKHSKEAPCPQCGLDLLEVAEHALTACVKVRYCPQCGCEVNELRRYNNALQRTWSPAAGFSANCVRATEPRRYMP